MRIRPARASLASPTAAPHRAAPALALRFVLASGLALGLGLAACADSQPNRSAGADLAGDGGDGRGDLGRDDLPGDASEDPGRADALDRGSDGPDARRDAGTDADMGADGGDGADADTREDTGGSDLFDGGSADADAGADTEASTDAGSACPWTVPTTADERVVLLGHGFTGEVGVPGLDLQGLTLRADGSLVADGERITLFDRPNRITFAPSGDLAFVLGEDGVLMSIAVHGADDLELIDFVELPTSADKDIVLDPERGLIHVVAFNSQPDGGVYVVGVDCAGNLDNRGDDFIGMRLSDSLVLGPGADQAILLGGQAVFAPVDDDDFRLLHWSDELGWSEEASFDIFGDFIDTGRMALSPDGNTLLVPNGSPASSESHLVLVVDVKPDSLTEASRITGLETATDALFAAEGSTALVTLFEPGAVAVLHDPGTGWTEVSRLRGIGLADQMAVVRTGANAERVLITSVDAAGEPNIAMVHFESPGVAVYDGQLDLGAESEDIPSAIGVAP
jgi:hypothetical protein